jgi:TolB protein
MRPDGTDQRRLTEGKGLNVYPRFSPDGRRIAYLHQERGTNSLWVVNIGGSGRRQVLEEENDTSPEYFCWSPDGKSLAYTLEDWQRDENDDGKNRRLLNLPRASWVGALDWP